MNDIVRANHIIYSDFQDDVVSSEVHQYIHENYIQDCCSNPNHVSIKRMHGSIFLNSIPNAMFDPDHADDNTQNFLSPVCLYIPLY